MINFNRDKDDYYDLYPFAGNIEFSRKRKPMAAAVKKKISRALKGRKKPGVARRFAGTLAGAAGGAAISSGGMELAIRKATNSNMNRNELEHLYHTGKGTGRGREHYRKATLAASQPNLRRNAIIRGTLTGAAGGAILDLGRASGRKQGRIVRKKR